MTKNQIEINGSIDRYSYSANYFRQALKNCSEGPVTVLVNSYGGDVNEALNICNQIAEHGDVTVDYIAFNASAVTLFGLYAKKSRISADALYLIHKASVWVDTWGTMNEDQLEAAISDLQEQKKTAEVATLTLAKCYVNKSGKPLAEILQMMKEAKWLTAEEVVNAGFVDEVIESKCKKKPAVSNDVAAIFSANGIPLPDTVEKTDEPEDAKTAAFLSDLKDTLSNFFSKNNKNVIMNKDFSFMNQVAGVDGFEVKNDTVTLTIAQMTAINEALKNADTAKTDHTNALSTAHGERDTAKNDLTTVVTGLDALDDTVKNAADNTAKLAAVKALIEKRPGVEASASEGKDNHPGSGDDLILDSVNQFFDE